MRILIEILINPMVFNTTYQVTYDPTVAAPATPGTHVWVTNALPPVSRFHIPGHFAAQFGKGLLSGRLLAVAPSFSLTWSTKKLFPVILLLLIIIIIVFIIFIIVTIIVPSTTAITFKFRLPIIAVFRNSFSVVVKVMVPFEESCLCRAQC